MDKLNSSAFPQKMWCSPKVYHVSHSSIAFKTSPFDPTLPNLNSDHNSLYPLSFYHFGIASLHIPPSLQSPLTETGNILDSSHLSPPMFQPISKSSWACLITSSSLGLQHPHCHCISLGTRHSFLTHLPAFYFSPFPSFFYYRESSEIQIWLNLFKII